MKQKSYGYTNYTGHPFKAFMILVLKRYYWISFILPDDLYVNKQSIYSSRLINWISIKITCHIFSYGAKGNNKIEDDSFKFTRSLFISLKNLMCINSKRCLGKDKILVTILTFKMWKLGQPVREMP